MKTYALVRSVDVHYAHRVPGHGGRCAGLHGHRGSISVRVCGPLQSTGEAEGMVCDFGDIEDALLSLKSSLCHKTLLSVDDSFLAIMENCGGERQQEPNGFDVLETAWGTFVVLGYVPTAENLAAISFEFLSSLLNVPERRKVVQVAFRETAKSIAHYPAVPLDF